ncbi:hypothetical protein K437DRAFT_59658 [Tilletiaria anomala UBC 951]|uniref:Uncharacterized protein n=1 Tax=Tilletiaria anomala (strain ATCC 24038 / CBS 436.72 / UBC 951) TaxID=1037660 RepID=A0A066WE47_TILAU|nr:uncharacterized protein K437DRAFT_59658 [Tilletiaria anomala UBC 951]KDN50808.1 hypothetical protein K437DRAFT_59658 [Tilletiaria anomala UBC 951]
MTASWNRTGAVGHLAISDFSSFSAIYDAASPSYSSFRPSVHLSRTSLIRNGIRYSASILSMDWGSVIGHQGYPKVQYLNPESASGIQTECLNIGATGALLLYLREDMGTHFSFRCQETFLGRIEA